MKQHPRTRFFPCKTTLQPKCLKSSSLGEPLLSLLMSVHIHFQLSSVRWAVRNPFDVRPIVQSRHSALGFTGRKWQQQQENHPVRQSTYVHKSLNELKGMHFVGEWIIYLNLLRPIPVRGFDMAAYKHSQWFLVCETLNTDAEGSIEGLKKGSTRTTTNITGIQWSPMTCVI